MPFGFCLVKFVLFFRIFLWLPRRRCSGAFRCELQGVAIFFGIIKAPGRLGNAVTHFTPIWLQRDSNYEESYEQVRLDPLKWLPGVPLGGSLNP